MTKLTEKELQEVFNIIEPDKELDAKANGDWVYGYYIEWKKINDLHEDIVRSLCDYFDIPFDGKTEEVCEQLREKGIPEETAYEHGTDFPEKEGYFYEPYDEVDYESYTDEIIKIENLILDNKNELVRKSLILSALIFTESFICSKIKDKIEILNLTKHTDPLIEKLINSSIINNLWREDVRMKTFKALFEGEIVSDIPYRELRNSLAHNIREAEIIEGKVEYKNKKGELVNEKIETVFTSLKEYAQILNEI